MTPNRESLSPLERERASVFHSWSAQSTLAPFMVSGTHGVYVTDLEGNDFLDFSSQLVNTNIGHQHPKVIAAARTQLDHFTHTCFQVVAYESYVELCERINQLAPGSTPKPPYRVITSAAPLTRHCASG